MACGEGDCNGCGQDLECEEYLAVAQRMIKEQNVELARLREEVSEWRGCAKRAPMMDSTSQFLGWDRSQMERCRKKYMGPWKERPLLGSGEK